MPADAQSDRPPPSLTKWAPTAEEQADLDAINAAFARIRKVTPQDPYRLTIPQDALPKEAPSYHHSYRVQAEQWLVGTPFRRQEPETAQYLTYHFHEPGKEIYVLENSWYEEEPNANGNDSKTRPGTGANTPNGAPKKKISLNAYKKQKTGGTITPERDASKASDTPAKQPAVKGPIERVKAESEEMLAAVHELEGEIPPTGDTSFQKNDMKRKRGDDESLSKPKMAAEAAAGPPAKKTKSLPEEMSESDRSRKSQTQASRTEKRSLKDQQPKESALPPRLSPHLSPGMPAKLSPPLPEKLSPLQKAQDSKSPDRREAQERANGSLLPSRLSPTLPKNIEESLQTRLHSSASKPSDAPTQSSGSKDKDDLLTPSKKIIESLTKHKSPMPRNGFRANSSSPAIRSDAEDKVPLRASATRPDPSEHDSKAERTSDSKPRNLNDKPTLLVKFKYRKSKRDDIQRILKMRSRPDKSMSQPARVEPAGEATPSAKATERGTGKDAGAQKGVAQKIGPVKKDKKAQPAEESAEKPKLEKRVEKDPKRQPEHPGEKKRSLPEDDKPSSPAKRKKTETSETRKEPSTPAQRDVDSPMAPKSGLHATPSTRKDILSQAMRREQSQDSNATHNTPPAIASTPSIGGNHSNGTSKPPSSQPSNKTPKQNAWEVEQKRLETLGRDLKHAASSHLKPSQSQSTSSPADPKLAAVKSIESFLCYLLAFTCLDEANLAADPKLAPSLNSWRSLQGFYGFVKRTTELFPSLYGLTCSLGVVFSAHILDITAQFPTDGPSRPSLLDTYGALHKAANDIENKFDIDALQEAFPKSWAQRSKTLSIDKLEPTKLGGAFRLPIGVATTPVRAARAGHVMLQEWLEKEKIDYTLKLKL